MRTILTLFLFTGFLTFVASLYAEEELDPPEIMLGERLFLETRFAQYFKTYLDAGGKVNQPINKGDPALNKTVRYFGLPPYQIPFADGPYMGQTYNCRNCHLVDEHLEQKELGMRSYADYAARSPLPTRNDGQVTTVRNAPALVDASLPREHFFMHFDGEFSSLLELVKGTLTNRNLGWLPGEETEAIEHICKVILEDDGSNELAQEFGRFSYTDVMVGKTESGKTIPEEYLLPTALRIDIHKVNCNEVFTAAANLIAIYTEDLVFAQDESMISPYDLFLQQNNLPTSPNEDETDLAYSKRLLTLINQLQQQNKLEFVDKNPNTKDGGFEFHNQPYLFGPQQLAGMQIFFNQNKQDKISNGNCIACHAAPHFTDFGLHNTGITQLEFDAVHEPGAFNKLNIPSLEQRDKKADYYLPATHQHPNREGVFRSISTKDRPEATDLGVWNILFNDDYSKPQQAIHKALCHSSAAKCKTDDDTLKLSIAAFKTPGLRDLGHSAPYMHNGKIADLHAIMLFYINTSSLARQDLLRNSDEEISNIEITPSDVAPLVAFLVSLYEDYN